MTGSARERENELSHERRLEAEAARAREATRRWQEANPGRVRASGAAKNARRRAAKAGAPISLDPAIIDFYELAGTAPSAPCSYCSQDPGAGAREVDHKISFAKGGSHALDNLCVACKICNAAKGDKTAEEFMALRAA
jgi:5-methylcytosine-specific restriction endonuclease McrA